MPASLPSLSAVQSLLKQTREKFSAGSANKIATKAGPSKKIDALKNPFVVTHQDRTAHANALFPNAARAKVDQLRQSGQLQTRPGEIVAAYDTAVAGNCYDMAMYALGRSIQAAVLPAEQISLAGGDHSFIVLGRFLRVKGQAWDDWAGTAFVVDPWTNTACPADQYPALFDQKMQKWQREGKKIGFWDTSGPQPVYRWIDAGAEIGAATKYMRISSDRAVCGGAQLTIYLYATKVVMECIVGDSIDYETTPLDEPVAYNGLVAGGPGDLYTCPYVSVDKACRRYRWELQSFAAKLPSLWDPNPFGICADYVRTKLYPAAPRGQAPTDAAGLEQYLGALIRSGSAALSIA